MSCVIQLILEVRTHERLDARGKSWERESVCAGVMDIEVEVEVEAMGGGGERKDGFILGLVDSCRVISQPAVVSYDD